LIKAVLKALGNTFLQLHHYIGHFNPYTFLTVIVSLPWWRLPALEFVKNLCFKQFMALSVQKMWLRKPITN